MAGEEKKFPTDFSKELFDIQITACEGGIKFSVRCFGDHKPCLHEVLGALEYMKMSVIQKQMEANKPVAEEYNKSQETPVP